MTFTPYSDRYKESCFQAWYAAGCPSKPSRVNEIIPFSEDGKKPNANLLADWRLEMGWDTRASELDARAAQKADDGLIEGRVAMLKEHAQISRDVARRAWQHLQEQGFDTASSAVNALFRALPEERLALGISEQLVKFAQMKDDDVLKTLQEYLPRLRGDEIIDLGESETDKPKEEDDNQE
jgi:hypothetical protein